ncbi:MAG: DNA-directed RNA polymerase subunit D [Candidatus Diapherotrites archaeon]
MNVKKISEEGNTLVLLVSGTHPQFMNAIRRIVMKSVPTLAIENVTIYKNDSVLFDEFLASRLGALPIKIKKSMKKGEKAKFVLKAKGPKMVYASDIESKDDDVEIVNKETPLVKLKEGQEIKIEMEAVMESGREHVKWQPAIIYYKELPEISNKNAKIKNAQKIVESCPKKVLEIKAGKIVMKNPYECTLCGYCEDISEEQIEVKANSNSFVLTIETFGQRESTKLLEEAAEILKQKTESLEEEAGKKIK